MRIEAVTLYQVALPLKFRFRISSGEWNEQIPTLVHVQCEGVSGWGESMGLPLPIYSYETPETAFHMLKDFFVPAVVGKRFDHPSELAHAWRNYKGHNFARAALETAFWDAWTRAQGVPLSKALGGTHTRIPVGVSVPLRDDVSEMLRDASAYLNKGYRRIKIKIEPGRDVSFVQALRRELGDIMLQVDANSAYTLADAGVFRRLDEYNLLLIEQPLGEDDIVDHAALQKQIKTPICLDESLHSLEDCRKALDIGACRIINVKLGRVGGHQAVRRINDLAAGRGVPLWCGGVLETGIGRAHNLHLTSLAAFTLPGDTAGSSRYWAQDIVDPAIEPDGDGYIPVPTGPGIGVEVQEDRIRKHLLRTHQARA